MLPWNPDITEHFVTLICHLLSPLLSSIIISTGVGRRANHPPLQKKKTDYGNQKKKQKQTMALFSQRRVRTDDDDYQVCMYVSKGIPVRVFQSSIRGLIVIKSISMCNVPST